MKFYKKNEFDAVVISGPTGSGKNKIANILGNNLPIMVINADAIQVYKKWKILSGRPTDIEQKKIIHKLYGHYEGNYYNVGKWLKEVSYYIDIAKKKTSSSCYCWRYRTLYKYAFSKVSPIFQVYL